MGRPDVHGDEAGRLRADHSGPAADPATCYVNTYVVISMFIYINIYLCVGSE